mgnify:CR=1 FL=1
MFLLEILNILQEEELSLVLLLDGGVQIDDLLLELPIVSSFQLQ